MLRDLNSVAQFVQEFIIATPTFHGENALMQHFRVDRVEGGLTA
jgi:hypothetical protein